MDPKAITKLAQDMVSLDVPGASGCASRIIDVADHLRSLSAKEEAEPLWFGGGVEPFGANAWWVPPRNLVAHKGCGGWSFWSFTLLPSFAVKRAFREDLGGIVIRPAWRPSDKDVPDMSVRLACDISQKMEEFPTLSETVYREMAWIEDTFGVKVPNRIVSGFVRAVDKQARETWGASRLEIRERLVPLDGGPSRDIGKWE